MMLMLITRYLFMSISFLSLALDDCLLPIPQSPTLLLRCLTLWAAIIVTSTSTFGGMFLVFMIALVMQFILL